MPSNCALLVGTKPTTASWLLGYLGNSISKEEETTFGGVVRKGEE